MLIALTSEQMRAAEQLAVDGGVSLRELMERAGASLAEVADEVAGPGRAVVLAGPGNNGGDGWVAARYLAEAGRTVRVISAVEPSALSGIAAEAAAAARDAGIHFDVREGDLSDADFAEAAVVVDALLGTGSTPPLRQPLGQWAELLNETDTLVVSADVPSGIDPDTGAAPGPAVSASITVTFAAPKAGMLVFPGAMFAGEVVIADIGVHVDDVDAPGALELWSMVDYGLHLPLPEVDANKYERGEVLVVAGSQAYAGAAVLAARGAQRMGAGYVRLAVPEPVRIVAQTSAPSVVTSAWAPDADGGFSAGAAEQVAELAASADAVVIGPGLGRGDGARAVIEAVLATDTPAVVDADALNAFAQRGAQLAARLAPTVITPHAGELGRLLGCSAEDVQADRVGAARRLAVGSTAVVLKGAGTIVADADRTVATSSGTPALATAGTGDVLAGMVGALLAAALEPLEAGALAAALHGRAGELAAELLSPVSVTAEDVCEAVPDAIQELIDVLADPDEE